MRFTHSSANSPVIDAFGGLISPPVRMIDALGRSVRSNAFALFVITVTSCAVMFEMIESAVELALMKMQSPSLTCFAASRAIALLARICREPEGLPSGLSKVAVPYCREHPHAA